MGKFSKKAVTKKSGGNDVAPEAWTEWNQKIFDAFDHVVFEENGKDVKEGEIVGVVNFMMDIGIQKREMDYESKVAAPKGSEEYSQEEIEYMEKYVGSDFIWKRDYKTGKEVRRQTSYRHDPSWIVAVDFPDILIDYNSHPLAEGTEEDLRPLRIDINGDYKGDFKRNIDLPNLRKGEELSDGNYFHKLAKACVVLEDFINSDYDVGEIAGGVCNFTVKI